jgi:cysteinyl-tRNA synthetase
MRAAIVFDITRRYLEAHGLQVTHVQNFTDIDDRIIERGRVEGVPAEAIATRYVNEYRQLGKALNILPPTHEPRATEHIPEIIDMVKRLITVGSAYYAEGDVYFDVTTFPAYGRLSGKVLDELRAGARVEPGERKRHPADFVLWKRAKPGEPSWDSPWGPGRPGWHIECSAMAVKYLGMGFDIHGGGEDLIFPHHEDEIAQSEAAMGTGPFVRYWIHNALVMVDNEKMSKSLKNYVAVSEALASFPPDVIRYALGAVHYRKPIEIDEERLEDAQRAIDRLRAGFANIEEIIRQAQGRAEGGKSSEGLRQAAVRARAEFEAAMGDDLNTSKALAAVFDLVAEVNRVTDQVLKGNGAPARLLPGLADARAALVELTGILGLRLAEPAEEGAVVERVRALTATLRQEARHLFEHAPGQSLEELLTFILAGREQARRRKEFAVADRIRRELADAGVLVDDLPSGPRWRLAARTVPIPPRS